MCFSVEKSIKSILSKIDSAEKYREKLKEEYIEIHKLMDYPPPDGSFQHEELNRVAKRRYEMMEDQLWKQLYHNNKQDEKLRGFLLNYRNDIRRLKNASPFVPSMDIQVVLIITFIGCIIIQFIEIVSKYS